MSSSVSLTFDDPITIGEWSAFCRASGIAYNQNTVGGNVFYADVIEICFGENTFMGRWQDNVPPLQAQKITVGTYWMGDLRSVARVAQAILRKWAGHSESDPEVASLMESVNR